MCAFLVLVLVELSYIATVIEIESIVIGIMYKHAILL